MSFHPDLEEKFHQVHRDMVPVLKRREPNPHLPHIVNLVSTTALLPQHPEWPKEKRFNLPLKTIAAKWKFSQYAPNLFAANIIKTQDSIASSTALLFVSGIMVVVSGLSENHARYVSQYIRLCIENTVCMMKRGNTNDDVYEGTLKGRTIFNGCTIHNIVGHGSVGMRVDLNALVSAAPECWKWKPDLFPGAKGKIWLTDNNMCVCRGGMEGGSEDHQAPLKKIRKRAKCKCSVKVLIFDTGQVVVTGTQTINDVNAIFKRIQDLAPDFQSSNQEVIPREDRFYHRLNTMMMRVDSAPRAKTIERTEMKQDEAVACIIAGIDLNTTATPTSTHQNAEEGATALMRIAEQGRVEEVEMLLLMNPRERDATDARGRTALDRLVAFPEKTPQIQEIIKLLTKNY